MSSGCGGCVSICECCVTGTFSSSLWGDASGIEATRLPLKCVTRCLKRPDLLNKEVCE